MKPFRVLTLDGGGMRGLYSAAVLDSFGKHFAACRNVSAIDVAKGFDLIVGTSTGGIIAAGLAAGFVPSALVDLFRKVGPQLFTRPIPDTPLRLARWALGSLLRAANSDESLRSALGKAFGDETLDGVYKRRKIALCIPSVNMATGQSIVFKTPHLANLTRDRKYRLADVCLSTSAAPIYLPMAALGDPDDPLREMILVDGGLWANNPVLIGLIEALLLAHRDQEIQILSISTCPVTLGSVANAETRHWGLWRWRGGTTALNVALESQSWGHHYMAVKLADALRTQGRKCYVIRVPHTAPSPEQAPYVRLDRASPDALRILIELGHRDSDFELGGPYWTAGVSVMVADMFLDMPEISENGRPHGDRRRDARLPRNLVLGAGLVLKDQSGSGARLLIEGVAPQPGATFAYALDTGSLTGVVKWVQKQDDGCTLFGVELQDLSAASGMGA